MRRLSPVAFFVAALASCLLPSADAQNPQWGDIKGRVVWAPPVLPLAAAIAVPPGNGAGCPAKVANEEWVVNAKNKGLKNVFVWLEANKGETLPIHPNLAKPVPKNVEIDQPACAFIPNAVAMRQGDVFLIKNTSAIAHNCKGSGEQALAQDFNILIPPGGAVPVQNLKASRLPMRIECNIHPWMGGWLRIYDHPYFAVTDDDGNFSFKDAPVGNFRLKVWHGSGGWYKGAAGRLGDPLAVNAGANNLADIPYSPP